MEGEFYSKQIFLKHRLIALIVKSSLPNHTTFFPQENKLYFEHRNNLETSETNFLLKL